ncbi:hypothetical protein TNCV_4380491 [Trichonephila clavipes]|nr:hypothetical protein TNCV_4380491 [Trichonephila clavipes]
MQALAFGGRVKEVGDPDHFQRHGDTLKSHRAASPLVRLVAGDKRWEDPDSLPVCSRLKLGRRQAKSYCHLYGVQVKLITEPASSYTPLIKSSDFDKPAALADSSKVECL